MINLKIPCSKISNFCGQNKFVIQEESFFNAYKKNNTEQYKRTLKKLKRVDKNEQNKEIIKGLEINDLIKTAITSTNNNDRTKVLKTVEEKIRKKYSSVPEVERKKIIKNVKNQADFLIKTEIGTKTENDALDTFEQDNNIKITSRNDELFYDYIDSEHVKLKMGGKIDGVNETEKVLIEHKQRLNRLFDSIPLYEVYQMYLYMNFTGMEKVVLIQSYKDQQTSIELEWNDEFYEIIVEKIRESLEKYYQLVTNPKKLENLIKKYTVPFIQKQKVSTMDKWVIKK